MSKPFSVRRNKTRATRLVLEGEASVSIASALRETLLELASEGRPVTIDCRKASHIDGAISQLLISAKRSWPGGSSCLEFSNVSEQLQAHFRRVGICIETHLIA